MHNSFESYPAESPRTIEDSEPLPITPELVGELIDLIKGLWNQHINARQERDRSIQRKLERELLGAYHELSALSDEIDRMDLPESLVQDIEDERWYACHHLHKMIKYVP